jgi:hypothetical protein
MYESAASSQALLYLLASFSKKTERRRRDYNENRPHSSLGNVTPKELAAYRANQDLSSKTIQETNKNDYQRIFLTKKIDQSRRQVQTGLLQTEEAAAI